MNGSSEGLISLYFHIPFCTKKCSYCHFYVLPNQLKLHRLLMEGLTLQIERWSDRLKDKKIVSIYFGGGTPSLIGAEAVSKLLDQVRTAVPFHSEQLEITIEANPETTTLSAMQEYASVGINRVSIGVQSLDDTLLACLGRTHHAKLALQAIEDTLKAGIHNISVDLMYDIPGQSETSWQNSLDQIVLQPISHLSLYNLTIEPQTVFYKQRHTLQKQLPEPECSLRMVKSAVETLEAHGLMRYEISAFARNGNHSIHNVGYWTARPFLGFGPSAFSYWEGSRFRCVAHLERYVQALQNSEEPVDFSEQLPSHKMRSELLAIALRLRKGVHIASFEKQHGKLDPVLRKVLSSLEGQDLIYSNEDMLFLTEKGMLFYDTVATEIV